MFNVLLKTLDDMADLREITITEADPDGVALGTFHRTAIGIFVGIGIVLAVFAGA